MRHSSLRPGRIGSLRTRNRIVYPPMVTNYCAPDGAVTERFIAYHAARARGGTGLSIMEASMILPEGRAFPRQLGIHDDALLPGLRRLTAALHTEGAACAIQLCHPGRQTTSAICGCRPMSPSPVVFRGEETRAMTLEDMAKVRAAYGTAAARAREAGFDAVELHAGNGYLPQQFHSRFTNRRDDAYGGPLGNRVRFTVEVLREIRRRVGNDYPVIVRLGVVEPVPLGLTAHEGVCIARILAREGIDALHVTAGMREGGALVTPPAALPHGTHLELARMVREALDARIPVIGIGRITDLDMADAAIDGGFADFVTIGRAQIAEPQLVEKCARGDVSGIMPCLGCNEGCMNSIANGREMTCAINPRVGREAEPGPRAGGRPLSVVVVGAGPAGCEAACTAAAAGHKVVLLEAGERPGGRLHAAGLPPFKAPLHAYAAHLEARLRACGVESRFGRHATAHDLAALAPDHVIIATGAEPFIPPIPGLAQRPWLSAEAALATRPGTLPDTVAIIGGGMVGAECAEALAAAGADVTLIEMRAEVAADVEPRTRGLLLQRLEQLGVRVLVGTRVLAAAADHLKLDAQGSPQRHPLAPEAGALILATGYRAGHTLADAARELGLQVTEAGDARMAGNILAAVRHGYEAALALCR